MINFVRPTDPFMIPVMDSLETIAEQIAQDIAGKNLDQVREGAMANSRSVPMKQNTDALSLCTIFRVAALIYYIKIVRNPANWLKPSDEDDLMLARKFLGLPTVDERKAQLKAQLIEKGWLT
jgi:hypothetical protein